MEIALDTDSCFIVEPEDNLEDEIVLVVREEEALVEMRLAK